MRKELPITEERLATMREPLSEEAEMVLDLMLSVEGIESEDDPVVHEFHEALEGLEDADRERILYINREIQKAYGRRIKESEGFVSLGERGMADITRAQEINPEVDTVGEARRLLLQHGIEPQTTEADLQVEVEVPPEDTPEDWISVPSSEMDEDRNGIPSRRAAKNGWGMSGPEEGEIIMISPEETDAMRVFAKNARPYAQFKKDHRDETEEFLAEVREALLELVKAGTIQEDDVEEMAQSMVETTLHKSYLQWLAHIVKEEPDLPGFIDHFSGRDSATARRYQERMAREMYDEVFEEVIAEKVESGLFFEEVNESGETVLKINQEHPGYKAKVAELEKKVEALSPERSAIFEALQHKRRGKARMNDFGAMDTVEKLTDAEVVALQPRLRRVRRGLELA